MWKQNSPYTRLHAKNQQASHEETSQWNQNEGKSEKRHWDEQGDEGKGEESIRNYLLVELFNLLYGKRRN